MRYKQVCVNLTNKNVDYLNRVSMDLGVPKSKVLQKLLDKFEDDNIDIVDFYKQ